MRIAGSARGSVFAGCQVVIKVPRRKKLKFHDTIKVIEYKPINP